MKKTFGWFIVAYGLSMSVYFGVWSFKDYFALEDAVRLNRPQIELRHRINVGFEGVWYLLSNMLVLQGLAIATGRNEKKNEAD